MKGWLSAVVIAEMVLLTAGTYAANQYVELPGVTAVHAASGKVFIGVAHDVIVADDNGAYLSRLDWSFGRVSSIATDEAGSLLVADGERGEVIRFDASGAGVRVSLSRAPRFNFEVAALRSGRIVIAATMDDAVWVFDATGRMIAEQTVRYPNGLAISEADGFQRILVVETGSRRVHAFDEALKTTSLAAIARAREVAAPYVAVPPKAELLDGTLGPGGDYALSLCRNTHGDCVMLRAGDSAPQLIADLSDVAEREEIADPLLLLFADASVLPNGDVLVASPRLSRVVRFSGQSAAPPRLGSQLPVGTIDASRLDQAPVQIAGLRASSFGDERVLGHFARQSRARLLWAQVEGVTRAASVALLLALLGLLLSRRLRLNEQPSRAGAIFTRIIKPQLTTLALAAAAIALSALVGAAPGVLLSSPAVSVSGAALVAFGVQLKFVAPWIARRRPEAVASAIFELHVTAAEPLRWARFIEAEREPVDGSVEVLGATSSSGASFDWTDALDWLFPPTAIVVMTDARLYCFEVGALGSVTGAIERWAVRESSSSRATVVRLPGRRSVLRLPAGRRVVAADGDTLCHLCKQPQRCAHLTPALGLPVVLSIVLPGLGHIAQARFARARALAVLALTVALDGVASFLPQWMGTLPPAPDRYEAAGWAYSALVFLALLDVTLEAARRQRLGRRVATGGMEAA